MLNPKLIVFDLDFTLWDCGGTYCDCLSPPFHKQQGQVLDSSGHHIRLFEDVMGILTECEAKIIPIALASRTERPSWAQNLLELLQIEARFDFAEIYPSSKKKHFQALHKNSGIPLKDMLFFDDEHRNIHEVSQLGVTCELVKSGITRALMDEGTRRFRRAHARGD